MVNWLTRSFGPRLARTIEKWIDDGMSVHAASTAYYMAFAFFPLLLVGIATLGFVLKLSAGAQNAREEFLSLLARDTSPELARQVDGILGQVQTGASFGGTIGLCTLALNIIWILFAIQGGFDRVWDVQAPREGMLASALHLLHARAKAFLLLAGLGLALGASFTSGLLLESLGRFADGTRAGPALSRYGEIAIGILVNTPIFAAIYRVQPRAPVRWRDVWLGSLLAATTWEIGRQVLSLFVISDRFSAYGVVGSFIAMMVWVYYASNLLFLGAEFVRVTQLHAEQQ